MSTLSEAGLYVSVSQLKTYLRCPRQYELRYVRGERPEFTAAALVLGSAVHGALAAFYAGLRDGSPLDLATMLEAFGLAWVAAQPVDRPLQLDKDEDERQVRAEGERMLRVFHAHAARSPQVRPVMIEAPFSVELHDPTTGEILEERLIGVMDLVAEVGDQVRIFEHKTSARRYSRDQVDHDLQATAYLLAARALGLAVAGLTYQVLTKTATPVVQVEDVNRTAQQEREFLATVVGVLRAIDAGAFYPVRGWQCRSCAHRTACDRNQSR
ncbi:MAG: PD-(D/E)XK nuclease family protein [Rhodoglobus sp.]